MTFHGIAKGTGRPCNSLAVILVHVLLYYMVTDCSPNQAIKVEGVVLSKSNWNFSSTHKVCPVSFDLLPVLWPEYLKWISALSFNFVYPPTLCHPWWWTLCSSKYLGWQCGNNSALLWRRKQRIVTSCNFLREQTDNFAFLAGEEFNSCLNYIKRSLGQFHGSVDHQ